MNDMVLLGLATGMRTMTAIAVVCWGAYLGYLPVQGTWAAWTSHLASVIVFTLFALGEYYGDTLPMTPSRKKWPLVLARLTFGIMVGVILATTLNQPKAGGVIFGALGTLIGIYGGYRIRMTGAQLFKRDLPMALLESAIALGIACYSVKHLTEYIVKFANRAS